MPLRLDVMGPSQEELALDAWAKLVGLDAPSLPQEEVALFGCAGVP